MSLVSPMFVDQSKDSLDDIPEPTNDFVSVAIHYGKAGVIENEITHLMS